MDRRGIGERSDVVLRTAMPGDDAERGARHQKSGKNNESKPRVTPSTKLIPAHQTAIIFAAPCSIEGVVDRGVRRRSRVRRPTMSPRWSAGRRRAPRKGPRATGPPPPQDLGSRKLGVLTPVSQAGEGSLASSLAPPGAPSPRKRGKENGRRAFPRGSKTKNRGGGALAERASRAV
jgi:hypothetical protein